jgi:ATP-dependent RNA helicase SUPV3L1/SUV3
MRRALGAAHVRIGRHTIYVAGLSGRGALRLLALVRHWSSASPAESVFLPPRRALSAPRNDAHAWAAYAAAGFRPVGPFAVRIDAVERLAGALHRTRVGADLAESADLGSLVGRPARDVAVILRALGYRLTARGDPATGAPTLWRPPSARKPRPQADAAGSFAALAVLRRAAGGS